MTKSYSFQTDDDRWLAFKLVATKKGLRVKDAIIEAIDSYIQRYQEENEDLKIEIIRSQKQRNLRALVDEQELIRIIRQLIERRRKRYDPFRVELRDQLLRKLRGGIVITEEVAEELKNLIKQCPEDFPEKIVESISNLIENELKEESRPIDR